MNKETQIIVSKEAAERFHEHLEASPLLAFIDGAIFYESLSEPSPAGMKDDWNVYKEYEGETIIHNGMYLPKCLHPKTVGILFAEFIAENNYEYDYRHRGGHFTYWNEVDDPQLHSEEGPELLTTIQLFIKFFKWAKETYPEVIKALSPPPLNECKWSDSDVKKFLEDYRVANMDCYLNPVIWFDKLNEKK